MNAYLRDKMLQKLETLSDERGYQVLDYIEFLESRYAERATVAASAAAAGNPLSRFADALEEKMRAGRVSASTVAETMGFMSKAMGVLNGAAAAGKSVASDLMSATNRVVDAATQAATSPVTRPAGMDAAGGGTTGASAAAPPGTPGGAGPSSGTAPGAGN